jgi:site-specific recombinase XerD
VEATSRRLISVISSTYRSTLLHSCGFKLANDGRDTRTIHDYLGHRSIQSTVRYTELASTRFVGLWQD